MKADENKNLINDWNMKLSLIECNIYYNLNVNKVLSSTNNIIIIIFFLFIKEFFFY